MLTKIKKPVIASNLIEIKVTEMLIKSGINAKVTDSEISTHYAVYQLSEDEEDIRESLDNCIVPILMSEYGIYSFIRYQHGKMSESYVERTARDFVQSLGIAADEKGYKALVATIIKGVYSPKLADNLSKKLSPAVARDLCTTAKCVEKNIRYAIKQAYTHTPYMLLKYFPNHVYGKKTTKPKPAEVISYAIDRISNKLL